MKVGIVTSISGITRNILSAHSTLRRAIEAGINEIEECGYEFIKEEHFPDGTVILNTNYPNLLQIEIIMLEVNPM